MRPAFPPPSLALLALAEVVACLATREPEAEVPVAGSPPDGAALDDGHGGLPDDAAASEARDSSAEASDAAAAASQDTPAVEAQIATLLGEMTLDEKVGQLVMVDYKALASADDVTTYFLGALLPSGDDAPTRNTPGSWLELTNQFRPRALATRLKIPLLVGIDAVHGNAKVAGATVFPEGIGLGCTRDPALVTQVERATAEEVLALGFSMSFSPDADVGQDARWGRTYESFGEDPALASQMVAAAIRGYQGPQLGAPGTLLACPKHALGAGETSWGTGRMGGIDEGDAQITEARMRRVHLPPFKAAVDAGALAIMVSYSSWNAAKMSASPMWLSDVIKGELGYRGLLLSDYDAIRQLPGTSQQQAATALNAGLDMIMMSDGYAAFISDVEALVASAAVAMSRIDDAVARILRAKIIAGLFGVPAPSSSALSSLGSPRHRTIARRAVRESLVLLKNDDSFLPLSASAHVVVAGAGGSDLGLQSGGWTLGWQGVTGPSSAAIGGTTLLAGMQAAATSPNLVTYSPDGSDVPAGTSVGVVVLSEKPYSEYEGDTNDPDFDNTSMGQNPTGHLIYDGLAAGVLRKMEAANVPLVLVLLTGRPVRIESYLPHFKAVVAAWLPGSEGEGVADVLYGRANFVGVLSRSWPHDGAMLPISSLQSGVQPLFAYGFGLKYP